MAGNVSVYAVSHISSYCLNSQEPAILSFPVILNPVQKIFFLNLRGLKSYTPEFYAQKMIPCINSYIITLFSFL